MRYQQNAGVAINDVIAGFYEAALSPGLWDDVMPRFSGLFNGAGVAFGVVNRHRGVILFQSCNFSSDCRRLIYERYHTPANNPCTKVAVETRPMTIMPLRQVVPESVLPRLDFYNDLMRHNDLWHGLLANVYQDADNVVGLASYRSSSAGDYDGPETTLMSLLIPHLNRSVRTALQVNALRDTARMAGDLIDRLQQGIIVTDAKGRIGFVNSAAEAILSGGDGLMIRSGILQTSSRRESLELARLIQEAAGTVPTNGNGAGAVRRTGAMMVSRPSLRQPIPVVVAPMNFDPTASGGHLAVSITITDPDRMPEPAADTLRRLYGLTRKEAELAILLARGYAPQTAADYLGVSITTVRTHIRQILTKTQTESVTDLVRRIAAIPVAFVE